MLTLWKPFGVNRFEHDFDDLFRSFVGDNAGSPGAYSPAVDVREEEGRFVLTADLPGVNEKDVEVKVHGDTLTLTGRREGGKETKKGGYSLSERSMGSFSRQFRFGEGVDAEKIDAEYKNGVLTINLPKAEALKPRQIKVRH